MTINVKINGKMHVLPIKPDEFFIDTLRNNQILSVKKGCDGSTCGSCTILLDNTPVLACSLLSVRADQKEVLTVEGHQEEVQKIADAFGQEGADQCGFCNPGIALMIIALKQTYDHPTDAQIKQFMVGNLCRCSGYQSQFYAIKRYLEGRS